MTITKTELEGLIAKEAADFRLGVREGLRVTEVRGGLYVENLNIHGDPIQLTRKQSDLFATVLAERLPSKVLAKIFGYSETVRRKQGYSPRASAMVGEAIDRGTFGHETLDGTVAPTREELPGAKAKRIPTVETYIKPGEPPTRVLRFREYTFFRGTVREIRPDEIVVEYRMGPAEAERVSRIPPMKFNDILRERGNVLDAFQLSIHSGDVNKPITDTLRVEHFKKTMNGGLAVLEHLIEKVGLRPTGPVSMSARDVYMNAPALLVRRASAALVRWLPEGTQKIVLTFRAVFAPDSQGVWKAVGEPNIRLRNIADVLTRATIRNNVTALTVAIEKALAQLAKHVH